MNPRLLRPACQLLAGLALLTGAAAAPQDRPLADHPDELRIPPLRPFIAPRPVRLDLGKGARLFVIESDELPLVDGTLVFRGGRRAEKPEQAGLAALTHGDGPKAFPCVQARPVTSR